MKNLKAKLRKQGGFTLIEMLIVVAIIAILVAVSIPLINSSLERARESTDAANERSFKAVLTIASANGKYDEADGTLGTFKIGTAYAYDAANGTITNVAPGKGYGKSTAYEIVDDTVRKGQILCGVVDANSGVIYMIWRNPGTISSASTIISDGNDTLIHPKMVEEDK